MKIGFIGLGIMGSRMAANLQRAGYDLVVQNRTRSRGDALIAGGARWVDTPQAAARGMDVVISMLGDPAVVRSVAAGENGFLHGMEKNALWMDCSTVDPAFSQEMAVLAAKKGVRFVDSPVAGTKQPAESGDLLFLVGGDATDVAQIQPLMDIMGKKTLHLGGHGSGAKMKMLINGLLAQAMLAFSEAVVLGEAMGFGKEMVLDVLTATPVTAPFLSVAEKKLREDNWETNFPLKWMQKDLQLASETAYAHGVAMPSLNTAKEAYALAKRHGFADQDFSAIFAFLRGIEE
ncbi:MAG: NAD(P)-dependent oxidoreductase [Bacteroidota bacterium]